MSAEDEKLCFNEKPLELFSTDSQQCIDEESLESATSGDTSCIQSDSVTTAPSISPHTETAELAISSSSNDEIIIDADLLASRSVADVTQPVALKLDESVDMHNSKAAEVNSLPSASSFQQSSSSTTAGASSRSTHAGVLDTSDATLSVYHVKWIKFHGSSTAIVMQNQNGPCPLLAIVNILLLQAKIRLKEGTELVAASKLIEYIANFIFDNVPNHITDATRLNYEQNMHDAIAVFPRLQTGLDVNVRFTGIHDFEYTPECIVFDLLDIPLVHGWLIDPELKRVAEALGSSSYNQLVEKIIQNKNSDKEELVTSALIAEEFLNSTASQLTYHGLCELSSTLNDQQLCILFRNNHFSTLYKRKDELFVLVTDQGFLNEANVVWETQSNVEGDGHFVDANFHTYRLPELSSTAPAVVNSVAPPVNSKEQIDHDYLIALSLEQDHGRVAGASADLWMETDDVSQLTDHELAIRLQREEDLKAGAGLAAGPGTVATTGAGSSGSGVSLHRQQKTGGGNSGAENGVGKEKKNDNWTEKNNRERDCTT